MKKFLALLLTFVSALALCLGLASCSGSKWTYKLSSDETYYTVKWKDFEDDVKVIDGSKTDEFSIPTTYNDLPVKALEICAFGNMSSLEEVILPAHIEIIGYRAFENCTNLKKVVLADTVKEIRGKAFDGCTNLEEMNIPESVNVVGEDAFRGCVKIWETKDGISYVDTWMVSCADNLTKLNLREGTYGVATAAGKGDYESASFPESLVAISDEAFYGTSLSTAYLGKNIRYIGEYAFSTTGGRPTIIYEGTKEDWSKVEVHLFSAKVQCEDGDISI